MIVNYESLQVVNLRSALINNNVMSEEEAAQIKGKSNLVLAIKKAIANGLIKDFSDLGYVSSDAVTDDVSVNSTEDIEFETINEAVPTESTVSVEEKNNKWPAIYSNEWQDFVLSHMTPEELIEIEGNKYTTVPGLRRVAELLLGEIIFSGPITLFPETKSDQFGRASVLYEVVISWRLNNIYFDNNLEIPTRTFRASAEAWEGNIRDDRFKPFPLPMAETRAESRALRKALFLRTQSIEEFIGGELPTKESIIQVVEGYNENETISGQQVGVINAKCLQLKIDVDKFAPNINTLKKKDGVELIKKINLYQTGSEKIPTDILVKE